MNQVISDYPADTGQSLTAWLDEWAEMEKARIARQQAVTLNMEGWHEKTVEQWAHIWCPKEKVNDGIKKLKEVYNGKTR